jgi:hypothetical protein
MATKNTDDITGEVIEGKDFGQSPLTVQIGTTGIEAKVQFFRNNRPGVNLGASGANAAMDLIKAAVSNLVALPQGTPSKSEVAPNHGTSLPTAPAGVPLAPTLGRKPATVVAKPTAPLPGAAGSGTNSGAGVDPKLPVDPIPKTPAAEVVPAAEVKTVVPPAEIAAAPAPVVETK